MKKLLGSFTAIIIGFSCIGLFTYNNYEKQELNSVISYNINDKDSYTPDTYNEYIRALNRAVNVKNDIFVSKDEIDNATKVLKDKINNLNIKPDKTILIDKYNMALNIDLNLYIPKSISSIKNSIEMAKKIIDNENSNLNDVNNAIYNIENSINLLILKPDKSILIKLVDDAKTIDENDYTLDSYKKLYTNIMNGYRVIDDNNSLQSDVDEAIRSINDSINNLVVAVKGVYKINYSIYMISNDHVGNDWGTDVTYNGNSISSGYEVTGQADSSLDIVAYVYEYDVIMDYDYSRITLTLEDDFEVVNRITVKENRGRYYGNIAVWEIKCSVDLVKII